MDTEETKDIRKRLGKLNTKAYYLLVALSFLYVKSVTFSFQFPFLPLAIGLTAFVAVVPLQDYFESQRALNRIRWLKVALLSAAFLLTAAWLLFTHAAPVVAAQKPAPPQTTEQQKPRESSGDLDSRLKELEEKSSDAAKERANVERSQKEVKEYYEKAFDTQVKFLEWLIILIAALPIVAGFFSLRIIDRTIEHATSDASSKLREEFTKTLDAKFAQLEKSHEDRLDQFEGKLQEQIDTKGENLEIRVNYSSWTLQGIAMLVGKQDADALMSYRKALDYYLRGKARDLFDAKRHGAPILNNLFTAVRRLNPTQPEDAVRKELADLPYDSLQQELAIAALQDQSLTPLINERKVTPPTSPPPTTAPPAPAAAKKSNAPAPDKDQTPKPQDKTEKK